MEIRKATRDDILSCVDMEYESFKQDKVTTRYELTKQVSDGDYIFLVAEENGINIGFITAKRHGWNKSIYIERLFVNKKYRKQGTGSRLLDTIKKIAKKEKILAVFVDTGTFYQYQVKFYIKNGFRIVGFVKDFYMTEKNPKDKDAVILCYKM
jgi:ribosomal-protein-alanine N-acetyltransferase